MATPERFRYSCAVGFLACVISSMSFAQKERTADEKAYFQEDLQRCIQAMRDTSMEFPRGMNCEDLVGLSRGYVVEEIYVEEDKETKDVSEKEQ